METRDFYEKEIANILAEYEQMDIKVSDYYRVKTIEMLINTDDVEVLQQVYSFVRSLTV